MIEEYNQLNRMLLDLENKRDAYNGMISNKRTAEVKLLKLNDEIAHYTIDTEYQSLLQQRLAQQTAEYELDKLVQLHEDLIKE